MASGGPQPLLAPVSEPVKLPVPKVEALVCALDSMPEAQRVLDAEGHFVKPAGWAYSHPHSAVQGRSTAMRELRMWCSKFGMTIADRGRVRVLTAPE